MTTKWTTPLPSLTQSTTNRNYSSLLIDISFRNFSNYNCYAINAYLTDSYYFTNMAYRRADDSALSVNYQQPLAVCKGKQSLYACK